MLTALYRLHYTESCYQWTFSVCSQSSDEAALSIDKQDMESTVIAHMLLIMTDAI